MRDDRLIHRLWIRFARRGFVGPRYEGIVGRLRFLLQELVAHVEVVLIAEPDARTSVEPSDVDMDLIFLQTWDQFAAYEPEIAAAYYPGYADRWKDAFESGEQLILACVNGRVAGFGWLQTGTPEGVPCHYTRVLPDEYRILRVGVLPAFRRRGVNTSFYMLLLRVLAQRGARRVYIDCNKDNVPSLKAQMRAGFRPIGEIRVPGRLFPGAAVRWLTRTS
jgi:RimJ/RimL family protein N-acetyltransferase